MIGYFALVTRQGEKYRYHVPGLEAAERTHPTVNEALYEAHRAIEEAADGKGEDLPDPRPSFEMIGEASKRNAVAAVCISAAD